VSQIFLTILTSSEYFFLTDPAKQPKMKQSTKLDKTQSEAQESDVLKLNKENTSENKVRLICVMWCY